MEALRRWAESVSRFAPNKSVSGDKIDDHGGAVAPAEI